MHRIAFIILLGLIFQGCAVPTDTSEGRQINQDFVKNRANAFCKLQCIDNFQFAVCDAYGGIYITPVTVLGSTKECIK